MKLNKLNSLKTNYVMSYSPNLFVCFRLNANPQSHQKWTNSISPSTNRSCNGKVSSRIYAAILRLLWVWYHAQKHSRPRILYGISPLYDECWFFYTKLRSAKVKIKNYQKFLKVTKNHQEINYQKLLKVTKLPRSLGDDLIVLPNCLQFVVVTLTRHSLLLQYSF